MPTRRTILASTALSIIGSAFPVSVIAKQVLSAPVVVVYENGIAESVAFKNALKRRASSIHVLKHDPAETFRELTSVLRTDAAVLGCSKGAAAFVMGELVRGQGGKMVIYGEHRYLPGDKVQHSLLLHDTGTQVMKLSNNWGKAMALTLNMEMLRARQAKRKVITTTMNRPATSPDYLVTWCFTYNSFKQTIRQPSPPLSQVL